MVAKFGTFKQMAKATLIHLEELLSIHPVFCESFPSNQKSQIAFRSIKSVSNLCQSII